MPVMFELLAFPATEQHFINWKWYVNKLEFIRIPDNGSFPKDVGATLGSETKVKSYESETETIHPTETM